MRILLIHNFYQQPGGEDAVFKSEGELLEKMGHAVQRIVYSNQSIQTVFDKALSGLKAIYNPSSARELRHVIETYRPDVIHLHNFLPIASPSIILESNRNNVPIVLTLHNYRLVCPSATLFYEDHIYNTSIQTVFPFDAIWKGVYRNSKFQTAMVACITAVHHFLGTWKRSVDCYIALTMFAKSMFEKSALALAPDKILVKPNFTQDYGCGDLIRSDFFLFVGRLAEEKGIRILLKAAISEKFKLVIIGDGPLRPLVQDTVSLHENITYLGFQPKATIIDYMKKCQALLFPSIWYEGFPVTIAEALSTATPVIASNLGGMKEIIEHKANGLLFIPGNEFDLAAKVNDFMRDPVASKKMSGMARTSYLSNYTPEKNYRQLMDVYQHAIRSHARANQQ